MKLRDGFRHIRDRRTFFDALERAIVETRSMLAQMPDDPYFTSMLRQLEAIQTWTANGREPTRDERKRIPIGRTLVRELSPAPTDEIERWSNLLQEVHGHFRIWVDDKTFLNADDRDVEWL